MVADEKVCTQNIHFNVRRFGYRQTATSRAVHRNPEASSVGTPDIR